MTGLQPAGLLHSEISGSKPAYGSPEHIAVSCVLLRLPVPRHSPCALCSLTMCFWFFFLICMPRTLWAYSLRNCRFIEIFPAFLLGFFSLYLLLFFIQFSMCTSSAGRSSLADKSALGLSFGTFLPSGSFSNFRLAALRVRFCCFQLPLSRGVHPNLVWWWA